jgi:hypothetical protein
MGARSSRFLLRFAALGLLALGGGLSEAQACSKPLAKLLTTEVTPTSTELKRQLQLELALGQQIEPALLKKGREWTRRLSGCINSPNLTPKQRRTAQFNLGMNLLVPTLAIAVSHHFAAQEASEVGTSQPDFPFDLMASVIVLYTWQSFIQCKNVLSGAGEQAEESFAKRYYRYFKMDLAGAGIYTGAVALEDWIRGRDFSEGDQWETLSKEAALSMTWDTVFSLLHVKWLDKLLLQRMGHMRDWVTELVSGGVLRAQTKLVGGKQVLSLSVQNWSAAPAILLDALVRYGYISARAYGYLTARNALIGPDVPAEETP